MYITVEDYNPIWKERFTVLKDKLWLSLSDIVVSIEHVGSTSVEGLAAKPIIDLDIIIDSRDKLKDVIRVLESKGYEHRGDLGVENREAFRCVNPKFKHNLYVCLEGTAALENHLALRNHLMVSPVDIDQYSQLKKQLAAKYPDDIDSYVDGKTNFILNILKQYNFDIKNLEIIGSVNKKAKV
ncbi:MAG: GrpB family protein [Halobacteriovoraceae bacterium]|jgi:GrpB-like predicted nucleotidyltransferase (UPF0157 family)|nr:GrpB family protein [Halobacteriovoraceae bacterium]